MDRTIAEMYTVGGIDIYIHKYLGPKTGGDDSSGSGNADATQPIYSTEDPLFIQDLFLLENRDRAYDQDIYELRGVYNTQDIDFDLSQFGLFIANDTLFITFHYNNMIDTIGRKLMNGDVIEVPNLRDRDPLDTSIAKAIPRYYVIQDAALASEGFSQTWQPHLWRVKCTPMVNQQEFQDVLKNPFVSEQIWDNGNFYPSGSLVNYGDVYYTARKDVPVGTDISNTEYWLETTVPTSDTKITTRVKDYEINDAVLLQAEVEVPLSGYDTVKFYIAPTNPDGTPGNPNAILADTTQETTDTTGTLASNDGATPRSEGYTLGYMTGTDMAPNGLPVTPGTSFPVSPKSGDYALRLDYYPNRLFRYSGKRWVKIEDDIRTDLTNGPQNKTLRSSFVNDTSQTQTTDRGKMNTRQSLSEVLRPKADNGG
jgi:hypothetical protein